MRVLARHAMPLAVLFFAAAPVARAQEHHHQHEMQGFFGAYGMSREASGTSWQPESSPMDGVHLMSGAWMLHVHGFADVVYDHQGGPRGEAEFFGPTMGMLMASRSAGGGTFGTRAMLSLDPATVGKQGYPLLLQTGEAVDGHPLIDRQHPHDLFMEMSASYSHPLGKRSSAFVYAGLPGEPALGPPTFMHRLSGLEIPEAPIAHHWLDSTHITFGVLTAGLTHGAFKLDASAFRGREPDERRWNLERPRLDSYSGRVQWNPDARWSLQASTGHLHSPEELEPSVSLWRTTVSASYNQPRASGNWQTTLAWGRNDRTDQRAQGAWMLESALTAARHTVFARAERVQKDELFAEEPLAHDVFDVARLSAGYVYDVRRSAHLALGLGGMASVIALPARLEPAYGGEPVSFMLFLRAALR